MPEFILNANEPMNDGTRYAALPAIVQGYIEALFFTDTGADQAADGLGEDCAFDDLAPDALAVIQQRCNAFTPYLPDSMVPGLTTPGWQRIGRDLHYTSNGHGVGFWDRPEIYGQANADAFSEAARKLGSVDLYRGNDGLLYLA